jgi:TonB family protein
MDLGAKCHKMAISKKGLVLNRDWPYYALNMISESEDQKMTPKNRSKTDKSAYWFPLFLALSTLLHFAAYFAVIKWVEPAKNENQVVQNIPLEFTYEKSLVLETPAPQDGSTKLQKSPLLSKSKSRVHEQTLAPVFGLSQNRLSNSKEKSKKSQKPQKSWMTAPTSDVSVVRSATLNSGPSAVSVKIDGVNVGSITALNTDAADLRYYSYFARILPQLRPRWERSIFYAFDNQLIKTSAGNFERDWVTVVDFYLDSEGNLQKSIIRKRSGLESLDEAAISSFENAAPFLNPPTEMVDENGIIRLRFGFVVTAPRSLAERK